MKTRKSTYDLLVQSQDKKRTAIETVIYAVFSLSAVVSICQFAVQPLVTPEPVTAQPHQTIERSV